MDSGRRAEPARLLPPGGREPARRLPVRWAEPARLVPPEGRDPARLLSFRGARAHSVRHWHDAHFEAPVAPQIDPSTAHIASNLQDLSPELRFHTDFPSLFYSRSSETRDSGAKFLNRIPDFGFSEHQVQKMANSWNHICPELASNFLILKCIA